MAVADFLDGPEVALRRVLLLPVIEQHGELLALAVARPVELGREINPKLYSENEWQDALNAQSGFIKQILASPMLPILGDTDDIRQSDREIAGAH